MRHGIDLGSFGRRVMALGRRLESGRERVVDRSASSFAATNEAASTFKHGQRLYNHGKHLEGYQNQRN
jgi:hypothetical protein